MSVEEIAQSTELRSLIEDCRSMCLWNVSESFVPRTREQILIALDIIERNGNLAVYKRAGRIRKWL